MKIIAICTGNVKPLTTREHPDYPIVLSGIDKQARSTLENPSVIAVERLGLIGDEQADLEVHGGLEKALYAYPYEHYDFWKKLYKSETGNEADWNFGQIGENLCISGLDEKNVYVGDRWLVGEVELLVTKLREPCYKFNTKMGFAKAAKNMVIQAKSGWYLKVIKPGLLKAGDEIHVIPGQQEISIADQNQALRKKHR